MKVEPIIIIYFILSLIGIGMFLVAYPSLRGKKKKSK